jgi:crotonobetainyl-CoA:carnitine CoA-transferase CaiB-like acyl-CoA transferase
MALMDVATAVMTNQAMNYLATGHAPKRLGNAHPNIVPYQVFDCADGYIIVASGNDGQYRQFCALLGLPELAAHPDYATNAARLTNRHALEKQLTGKTKGWTKLDLLATCEAHGIPAGPINDMAETFADPQVIHRGMQIDLDGVPSVRLPITFSDADTTARTASPKLGQNQDLLS